MTEVWFYHLQSQPLERALPAILEKAVGRGWRVVVQTVDDLRLKALDDLLWTHKAESFLAHGLARDKDAERQPILLTRGAENPNGARMRVFVEGAEVEFDPEAAPYDRVALMFDGGNDEAVEAARRQWRRLKEQGIPLAYWQQTEAGGWERVQ